MREIPISSVKADDNGAYISKGSVGKFYVYNENGSRTSHKDGNGVWYVNVRDSRGYRKEIVPPNEIFELKREYHASNSNPKFSRAITTIKAYTENLCCYVQMGRWRGSTLPPFPARKCYQTNQWSILQERSQSFLKG